MSLRQWADNGWLSLCCLALVACQGNAPRDDANFSFGGKQVAQPELPLVRDHVFRDEALATALWYAAIEWIPGRENIYHGRAADGIRVDTPDAEHLPGAKRPGWKVGELHHGMPYHWGGFSTPTEFLAGLEAGRPVGDMYTTAKRQGLEAAVSRVPVGIDCSGFISRCWKLPRGYSTRTLPEICFPLASFDELLPGDILNLHNNHVILFEHFAEPDRQDIICYEAGSPLSFFVGRHAIPAKRLRELGYQPYRYRGIRDRGGK